MKASPSTRDEVAEVRRRLRDMGDPRAAKLAKAALRSPFAFHGVIPPRVRALAREIARRHRRDRDLDRVLATAQALWKSRWHEEKSVAIHMVAALVRRLDHAHWPVLKDWVAQVRSADHGDGIAVDLLGCLVKRDRAWCRVLKHWALSRNVWERRAGVLAVLLRTRQMGDLDAAFEICESLMRDRDPRVQQALAAVLSEALAFDPVATRTYLNRWKGKAPAALLNSLLLR